LESRTDEITKWLLNNLNPAKSRPGGILFFTPMKFLEKDLESIIFETENSILNSKGLPISGKKSRQKKIGNYGRLDLMTSEIFDDNVKLTIYELKKEKIDDSSIIQCLNYCAGVKNHLEFLNYDVDKYIIKPVIIGKEVDIMSELLLSIDLIRDFNGDKLIDIYTYQYNADGIKFTKGSSLVLINEGF